MMNFKAFQKWAQESLEKRCPEAVVRITPIHRGVRGSFTGLSVLMPGQKAGIVANLDVYYMRYCHHEDSTKLIDEMLEECVDESFSAFLDKYLSYDVAKDRLFAQLRCLEDVNDDQICYQIGDFAMIFFLMVGGTGNGWRCMQVTESLLEQFDVSPEELMRTALKNSEKLMPPLITPMGTYIKDGMDCDEGSSSTMILVTNKQSNRGAVVLFYEGVMERIANYLQDDLLIIPSSIHEMLVVPFSEHAGNEENLEELIQELNESRMVRMGEKLSDHLYFYNRFTHGFAIVLEAEQENTMIS